MNAQAAIHGGQKEEDVRRFVSQVIEKKVADIIEQNVVVETKEISYEEFNKLFNYLAIKLS